MCLYRKYPGLIYIDENYNSNSQNKEQLTINITFSGLVLINATKAHLKTSDIRRKQQENAKFIAIKCRR